MQSEIEQFETNLAKGLKYKKFDLLLSLHNYNKGTLLCELRQNLSKRLNIIAFTQTLIERHSGVLFYC